MEVLRYVAFSEDPEGGNPAGVVLDATGADDALMAATAADVGFSETAFMFPQRDGSFRIRYFSPLLEVPFCGHATVATAVAHAQRNGPGDLLLHTRAGPVPVATAAAGNTVTATLTSVPPTSRRITDDQLAELLATLRWSADDLDAALPPSVTYAGAWHPVVPVATRERLANLDYDLPALTDLMQRHDWATVNLVWRQDTTTFHCRNPFPVGGVVEDPATGAAAAALGGYLRENGLVAPPVTVSVHQGADMGRPSLITLSVPADPQSGILVTGTATSM